MHRVPDCRANKRIGFYMTEQLLEQTDAADQAEELVSSQDVETPEVLDSDAPAQEAESSDEQKVSDDVGSASGDEPELPKGVEKRIKSLTAQIKRLKEEQRAVKQQTHAASMQWLDPAALSQLPGAPKRPEPPDPDLYGDDLRALMRAQAKYTEQYADYLQQEQAFRQAVAQAQVKIQAEMTKEQAIKSTVLERVNKFAQKTPDFIEKVQALDALTAGIAQKHHTQAISKSELSAEILYYFANNPDEALEFSALDPIEAGYTVASLERKLQKGKGEPKPSYAPMGTVRKGTEAAAKELSIDDLRKIYSKR